MELSILLVRLGSWHAPERTNACVGSTFKLHMDTGSNQFVKSVCCKKDSLVEQQVLCMPRKKRLLVRPPSRSGPFIVELFSLSMGGTLADLPQSKNMLNRLITASICSWTWMWAWMIVSFCCPVIGWLLVQGVPHLSPNFQSVNYVNDFCCKIFLYLNFVLRITEAWQTPYSDVKRPFSLLVCVWLLTCFNLCFVSVMKHITDTQKYDVIIL